MKNKNKKYTIYCHTNKINGKKYIGITCKKLKDRWENGEGYKGQIFYNAIQKYGWDNFEHEVLMENVSEENIDDLERWYIKHFNSLINENGYNISKGGRFCGNGKSRKIICLNTGKIYNKIVDAEMDTGLNNSLLTRTCKGKSKYCGKMEDGTPMLWQYYEENVDYEKLKNKLFEKIYSPNITKSSTKIICLTTNEIFDSIDSACKKYNLFWGNLKKACKGDYAYTGKHSKTNEKLQWMFYEDYLNNVKKEIKENKNQTKVICLNNLKIFNSLKEAKEYYNLKNYQSIYRCCIGKQKTYGTFNGERLRWSYYEDYINSMK